jgi:molybdopterin-guanine dinucleotide biosynthesis protein A
MSRALLGVFVGGRGTRMGGVQKALLRAPGGAETLLARALRVAREAGCEPVLLGAAELGDAARGIVQLPDRAQDIGPLAGLASLLDYAADRPALCLACDMPYVSSALLARLMNEHPDALVLAPRDRASAKWQPLCARYASARVAPILAAAMAEGVRSFQALFGRITVTELLLTVAEHAELRDWDKPEDIER